jgi:hypothetical protein
MDLAPHGKYYAGKIYYPRVEICSNRLWVFQGNVGGEEEMRLTQSAASYGVSDRLKRMIAIASNCSWVRRMWTVLEKSDPLKVGMKSWSG